ncbi:ABC transporter substrate-binding protein [Pseudonocardia sp. GCM10023141]|uniref:ABC transporter substrate-binding protein n=1 Tax=Pseudonocardia sp. GCM10023141 TaxID=3252653 RepID=UPI0036103055
MHGRLRHHRVFMAAAAALALAAVAACGSGGSATGSAPAAGDGPVTLTFWTHTHPPMVELNKKIISEYEAQHPNVKIEYQTVPNTEFATKMLTALSTGAGPDIINMDDGALRGEYIPKKLLVPVDPAALGKGSAAEVEAGFVPGTLDGAKGPDGKLYGLPSEFNGTVFAINKKHFADAGLDPAKPPATWQEVIDDGKKLNAAGHKQAFNFLYLHSGWYAQWFQTLANETGATMITPDGKTTQLDSPGNIKALQTWVDLARTSGIADPKTSSRDATSPYQDITSGTQSMAIMFPWAMEQIKQDNPEVYSQLQLVPLPAVDTATPPINRIYGYFWAVNAASKKQAEAWKFISYLSSQHDRWLTDVSFVQPVVGWDTTPAAQKIPFIDVIAKAYGNGRFDQVGPHWNEVQDIIHTAVDKAVFDGAPVADVLRDANAAAQRSIS